MDAELREYAVLAKNISPDLDKLLGEIADITLDAREGNISPEVATVRTVKAIKARDAAVHEEGFKNGMEEALSNALYHLAYSGRKTIKGKDLDKLFRTSRTSDLVRS